MTARDYELIARILAEPRGQVGLAASSHALLDWLADRFAADLAEENPRFDRERFLLSAGADPTPGVRLPGPPNGVGSPEAMP